VGHNELADYLGYYCYLSINIYWYSAII